MEKEKEERYFLCLALSKKSAVKKRHLLRNP